MRKLPLIAVLMGLTVAAGGSAAPKAPEGVTVLKNRKYVRKGHDRQKLDLYIPPSRRPLPVLVWIHGGGWTGGEKSRPPLLRFTTEGYAVASLGYRFSQDAKFPAQIHDVKAAIRWLRAHAREYNLDPERIAVAGGSAGGHLAALLGTSGGVTGLEGNLDNLDQSSKVRCVVDLFGPADLALMRGPQDTPGSAVARLLGGPADQNPERAERASPLTYVDKDDPPFLIMHGDEDRVVPFQQSELLFQALRKAGVDAALVTVPGAGHGGPDFYTEESVERMRAFFRKHLQPEPL